VVADETDVGAYTGTAGAVVDSAAGNHDVEMRARGALAAGGGETGGGEQQCDAYVSGG
jgi:hypothetical protein